MAGNAGIEREVRLLASRYWQNGGYDSPADLAEELAEAVRHWLQAELDNAPVCRHRSPYCGCPGWYRPTAAGFV